MDKVMLVMDKPNACIECPLCFKADEMSLGAFKCEHLYSCKRVSDGVEDIYLEDILHKKPDWCPLKDIPKKIERASGDMDYYKAIGFNACIDEILKEDDKMDSKYTVKWTSQALGCATEKRGEIISIIPQNESAYGFLPNGIKKSHIKFGDKSMYERVLVRVKVGANKNIDYYYAPLRSTLEKQGNAETIRRFVNP